MRLLLTILFLFAFLSLAKGNEKIIERVNAANAQIKSFTADFESVTHRRALTITAEGKCYFQKPKNFRWTSVQERNRKPGADLGSNDDMFWFWIRRLDPNTLYYSKHSNLHCANLSSSISPIWMMDSMCLNQVEVYKNSKITEQSGYVMIQTPEVNQQKQIIRVVTIDVNRPVVIGHRIYGQDRKVLAASSTTSFYKTNTGVFVPHQIEIKLYSEQITITVTFNNPRVNTKIDPSVFKVPGFNGKTIDIGNSNVDFEHLGE